MKNIQRLPAAVALAFAFTLPAAAGVMDTGPGAAPPTAAAPAGSHGETTLGHIETGVAQGHISTGAGVAWGQLEAVLALL